MKRPLKTAKQWNECTDEEKELIDDWYQDAHPSNFPKDKTTAWWDFYHPANPAPVLGFLI